jgi:NADPH:quinone reductase-like Zn-dependent oxidoreductase
MKAFIVDRYGKKDGVRIGEMPDPEVRENDVLVQVHAAAVNLLDSKIRNGEFKLILPYRLPLILGNDVAGVVLRVGPRVRQFKPGDQVYARPPQDRIGSFAELISMNEDAVAIMPKKLTMEEAASIPLVGLTAWQALIERANLKKGQKVLIHAGSGGVGTFAIQLAKHLGAIVATTTSTANLDLAKRLGADVVIDYRKDDFEQILHDYDVVLNSLEGETLEKSLRVLKPGGKLISISGPPDPDFAKAMGDLPVANVRTVKEIYDRSMARSSFTLVMLALAAGMALLLGVVGIYGVISYSISQRIREIGIRMALGATPRRIRGMFVRHGLLLAVIGVACGVAAAIPVTRLMSALLFEVSPLDARTYCGVSVGLVAAALLASYVPARRATRVEPVEALRAE